MSKRQQQRAYSDREADEAVLECLRRRDMGDEYATIAKALGGTPSRWSMAVTRVRREYAESCK